MDLIGFRKELGNPTHTVAATVAEHSVRPDLVQFADYHLKPEVFARFVEEGLVRSNPPPPRGRMRNLKYTVEPDSRLGYCARQITKAEDVGSPFAKDTKEGFLLQEDFAYFCLHPDSPTVAVEIDVSEQARADELLGQDSVTIKEIRERFFAGFQFRKLN